jgi:hypothetical protein
LKENAISHPDEQDSSDIDYKMDEIKTLIKDIQRIAKVSEKDVLELCSNVLDNDPQGIKLLNEINLYALNNSLPASSNQ